MSFLIASPEALAATATYLTGIGSAINAANAVAAAPTTEILAAGTDEVSTAISALFGAHAQAYQALSAHVAAFHDQFVHTLTAGAGSYMAAEAAASPLQALQLELLNAINAPTLALLGRPLIGDGTDAAPGSGGAAGSGGNGGDAGTGVSSDGFAGLGGSGGRGGDAGLIGVGGG
ncbi:PE family protein, partial [Mycobacterium tuberculosis]|uniref:PE family protein n=1 Tax=Mycobacterium tuberculosis TaxID=1773 RepID=UPI0015FEBB13